MYNSKKTKIKLIPLVNLCMYSMSSDSFCPEINNSPLQEGHEMPQPAPEPVARTIAPRATLNKVKKETWKKKSSRRNS